MEIVQSEDPFTIGPDGKPSRVTDYKLSFPSDFKFVEKPELAFITDKNYMLPFFRIMTGQLRSDIAVLRAQRKVRGDLEHALLNVNDGTNFYQAQATLVGETGIGYQITPKVLINDFLHTHSIREEEEEKSVDLFSAFDLLKMGSDGAERSWIIGEKIVWALINFYGQRYYYSIKDACWEMAKKYHPQNSYDTNLSNLIEGVRKCEYRLYRSDDSINYTLIS